MRSRLASAELRAHWERRGGDGGEELLRGLQRLAPRRAAAYCSRRLPEGVQDTHNAVHRAIGLSGLATDAQTLCVSNP